LLKDKNVGNTVKAGISSTGLSRKLC